MRTSKYLNKEFGAWQCVHVGVAYVQAKWKKAHRGLAKRKGARTYYYCFTRRTSDDLADKMIRVDAQTAAKIYRGDITCEQILDEREARDQSKFTNMVSYHFDSDCAAKRAK